MNMNDIIDEVYHRMVVYYRGDPVRIQHFVKVHSFSSCIGKNENLPAEDQLILEVAALTHDIGIKPAEEKYGNCSGPLQEKEGPAAAQVLLESIPLSKEAIDRVLYLIAHHHTYSGIDGLDYQILVENQEDKGSIKACLYNIFKTQSGKILLKNMFLVD